MGKPLPKLDDLVAAVAMPDRAPLQNLVESVGLARHLNELADHLIGHLVDEARNAGASWAEIGDVLGVTKQAAQKRFAPRVVVSHQTMGRGPGTFSRFTDLASLIVVGATRHCERARHEDINTGHIVLAMLDDPSGITTRVLAELGIWPDQVREAIRTSLGPGQRKGTKHIPFAADAKKVLQLSLREAFRVQSDHIGPEHILLAVLRDEKSAGAKVLTGFGVNRKHVERAIAG